MPGQCSATWLLPLLRIGSGLLKCFELNADRFEVLVDRLLEQAPLAAPELLAAPTKAPALEDPHLMGQLIDPQLLDPDRLVLLRQLSEQPRCELA
jgi:hypothetical protein